MPFTLPRYLDRIALPRVPGGYAGLCALQEAQLRAIPFETTQPFLGATPDVTLPGIWERLVTQRLGGYCFELNGLLGAALSALGTAPRPVLARVRMGAAEGGQRSHLAFLVEAEGAAHLVDAGFGGPGPVHPLRLDTSAVQTDPLGARFRLREEVESGETVLERETEEGWFALYGFDRVAVKPIDIAVANHACATAPFSRFPRRLMMARLTPDGRVALSDRRLSRHRPAIGGKPCEPAERRTLDSAAALHEVLQQAFALPQDAKLAARLWDRLAAQAPDEG